MGMGCEGAARAAVEAVSSGSINAAEARSLEEHLRSCRACAGKYAAILPFARRDSGGEFFSAPREGDAATVRAVMAKLPPVRPGLVRERAFFRPAVALAVAAALAVIGVLAFSRNRATVEVRFTLYAPEAGSVSLAADFTSWAERAYEMKRTDEPGIWEIRVKLRRDRSYLYNFVVNGEAWIPDPAANVILDDGFGNKSSLLSI